MHAAASSHAEPPRDAAPAADQPSCPVCGGRLIALARFYRCTRCSFTLCVGCEAPAGGPDLCE